MCIWRAARSGAPLFRVAPARASTKRGNCAMATRNATAAKASPKRCAAVNETIARRLAGWMRSIRQAIDRKLIELDGTPNKKEARRERAARRFAGECARGRGVVRTASALSLSRRRRAQVTLPVPMMNILNGGAHSDAPIDFQEFMIMPKGAPTFAEALRYGAEVFHALKERAERSWPLHRDRRRRRLRAESEFGRGRAGMHRDRGREGRLQIRRANFHRARSGGFGVLRSRKQDAYVFKKSDGSKRTAEELIDYYAELCDAFPDHLDRGRLRGKRLGRLEED